MFVDEDGCEHNVARYFQMGGWHIVQCDCGEKFKEISERMVMQVHYNHALAKVQVPF